MYALDPFLFVIVLDYAMRTALKGKEALGFMLSERLSRRYPAVTSTYLSYADGIAFITNQIEQAQEFLTRIEIETEKIGLRLNSNKTEVMVFNHLIPVSIYSKEHNTTLKVVDNFKYLGSWMASSNQYLYIYIRKAMSWRQFVIK